MQYCAILKNLRIDHDLSQAEVAALLDTTQSYYSQYEAGKYPLPVNHLITLCRYYKVSADYVLGLPKGLPYGLSKTK